MIGTCMSSTLPMMSSSRGRLLPELEQSQACSMHGEQPKLNALACSASSRSEATGGELGDEVALAFKSVLPLMIHAAFNAGAGTQEVNFSCC